MLDFYELREALDYDRDTGVFRWRSTRSWNAVAGSVAGGKDSKGYTQIKFNGRLYLAHRLAWLWVTGSWPTQDIDHKDRNPANNAFGNLRLCTHAENHQNTGVRADSSSGHMGVSWNAKAGKWLAYINRDGERHRLGLFVSKWDAVAARDRAKAEIHTFA